MATIPIIDPHIHLWDPRSNPRPATPFVKLLGWNQQLLRTLPSRLLPRATRDFVGRTDYLVSPYLPPDYAADHGHHEVEGYVYVEASWTGLGRLAQADETRWAEALARRHDRVGPRMLGIVAAAWIRQRPTDAMEIRRRLTRLGVAMADAPTLRFVLSWETDANDVDLHVQDAAGGHAFYAYPILLSGGSLYADVTNGYGPECLTVPDPGDAYPYRLSVHYYSRGSMGYGMGKVQVLLHDGEGRVRIEDRPFVVMQDQAQVDLGLVWPSSTAVADAAPPRPPVIAR